MIELESRSRSARTITTVLRGIVFVGLTLVAACGKGDDLTGPGGGEQTDGGHPGPVTPKQDLSGTWTLNITFGNAVVDLSCNSRSQMRVQHSGSSISGEYSGGTVTCSIQGQTFSGNVHGSISGTVSGDKVSFQDDGGARFSGTLSSDSKEMQGDFGGLLTLEDGQQLELSGNWSASR
jgi:hypothetical protein